MFAAIIFAVVTSGAWANCEDTRADLRGDWGTARFNIEVADEPEEVQRGLMFREALPANAGMLFIYDRPQLVGFWMKNTLIPLDMIFIGADGVVRKVHQNAIPGDETTIIGGSDIQFVLEINGGMTEMLGIGPGSELRHPRIDQALAAWDCAAG
ncbi:MAG: DUF192 domain-containing protein [Rhodobacter sp.]|nr:DUF192 domain-containing protein [Rhodobacter sp.]